MKSRKTLIGLIVIVLLASFGAVAFALQTSAADLLTQSLERLEAAQSGHAIVAFEVDSPEQSGAGTLEVWGQLEAGPNGEPAVRFEVLDASFEEMVGKTAVTDGTQFWIFDPAKNQVIVGTFAEMEAMAAEKAENGDFAHDGYEGAFDPESFAGELPDMPHNAEEAVALLLEYFNAERAGRTTIGGNNNANVIRLVPIPEQMPDEVRVAGGLINVWVRRGDTAPLGAEYVGGALGTARMEVTTLELDLTIDAATFTFEVPDGVEIVHFSEIEHQARAAEEAATVEIEPLLATALPDGAVLQETIAIRGAIVQRYALADGASFTIAQGGGETAVPQYAQAQTLTVRGAEATLFTDEAGNRTLLSWSEGGFNFWVGGDLTADQAVAIAESLR